MAWWHSTSFHLRRSFIGYSMKTANSSAVDTLIPYCTYFSPFTLISSRVRQPPSCIDTSSISVFMAQQSKWSTWISIQIEYPNFQPHHANSHRIFALKTSFGTK
ncbi:hypothetical protein AVEN_46102-1 [Araneus ventricosus]|uniref:Uncharacterized protein n=1 Tax=Araneus ventricosus TaxID=182803 RepID=A0A4Y2HIV1_ARAVE|nr:hypothetical protein AVEN_46102-1 [Araneus ventricosus]